MYRLQNGQMEANLDSKPSIVLEAYGRYQSLQYSLTGFYRKKSTAIFQSSERLNLDDGETEHKGVEYDLFWS